MQSALVQLRQICSHECIFFVGIAIVTTPTKPKPAQRRPDAFASYSYRSLVRSLKLKL